MPPAQYGLFEYNNLVFDYTPFPTALAKPFICTEKYPGLADQWPELDHFEYLPNLGKKYSLSENVDAKKYYSFINSHPDWKALHDWIKKGSFIEETMQALNDNHIDLGYRKDIRGLKKYWKRLKSRIKGRNSYLGRRFVARMEFQMMPADGGCILPHTDTPAKVVTLIVSMQKPGEWQSEYGGGTEICIPKDNRHAYNLLNTQADFDDMKTVKTFEFGPNQAVVFVKTYNSWHQVQPMTNPDSTLMRKTLIINIFDPK